MYSMVLMAALTTGTDLPDWGRRGGWGCCGCYGGGYGWGGCRGGGWGGCYGGYGWGGWGGGYGGYGWGGWGGWGGGWGGWGGYSGWGGLVSAAPIAAYSPSAIVSNTRAGSPTTTSLYYNADPSANRRANVIVHLPANAKLSVDGKATRSTSATRRFSSPPLEAGQSYHYVFKAKMDRDGEPVEVSKRVDVRAGESREITLKFPDREQSAQGKQELPARPAERKETPIKRIRAG